MRLAGKVKLRFHLCPSPRQAGFADFFAIRRTRAQRSPLVLATA
jgi:hypothetical protein